MDGVDVIKELERVIEKERIATKRWWNNVSDKRVPVPPWVGQTLILFLIVYCLWYGVAINQLLNYTKEYRNAQTNAQLTSQLFSALKDAESGQRAYLLSSKPAYLEQYYQGIGDTRRTLASIHAIMTNELELPIIERVDKLVTDKLTEMKTTVEAVSAGHQDIAKAEFDSDRGFDLMVQIRQETYRLFALERARQLHATLL